MWIDPHILENAESFQKSFSSLFSALSASAKRIHEPIPIQCHQCGSILERKPVSFLNIFISICPHQHTAWVDSTVALAMINYKGQTPRVPNRRGNERMLLISAVVAINMMIAAFICIYLQANLKTPQAITRYSNLDPNTAWSPDYLTPPPERITTTNWPNLDFYGWYPFYKTHKTIIDIDEQNYFDAWAQAIEPGITHRMNIERILNYTDPKYNYQDIKDLLAYKYDTVILNLTSITPPERLRTFHNYVIQAARNEVVFYTHAFDEKIKNPSLTLTQLIQNPLRAQCSDQLWKAYYEFQRLYPKADRDTNNAVERRLGEFDII